MTKFSCSCKRVSALKSGSYNYLMTIHLWLFFLERCFIRFSYSLPRSCIVLCFSCSKVVYCFRSPPCKRHIYGFVCMSSVFREFRFVFALFLSDTLQFCYTGFIAAPTCVTFNVAVYNGIYLWVLLVIWVSRIVVETVPTDFKGCTCHNVVDISLSVSTENIIVNMSTALLTSLALVLVQHD